MSLSIRSGHLFLLLATLAACKADDTALKPVAYTMVSTLAGAGTPGYADGTGAAASFNGPEAIAVDAQGNTYVADYGNASIRKITPTGVVSTLAGNATAMGGLVDGQGTAARFAGPMDVALDSQNNLYIADENSNSIRKITPAGLVSTVAGAGSNTGGHVDGAASQARFNRPMGVAVDAQGVIYVADHFNFCIRKILPNGTVSTLAGNGQFGYADGPGASAQFKGIKDIVVDANGTLYVSDIADYRIRKVTPAGVVSTLAGTGQRGYADGPGSSAQFHTPCSIALDDQGYLYVAEDVNHYIRKIDPLGNVTTLTGTGTLGYLDGPIQSAQFSIPTGLAIGTDGTIYVTEGRHRIRKIVR